MKITTVVANMALAIICFVGAFVGSDSVFAGEVALPVSSKDGKVIVAYVTSWSRVMPDPKTMTHINYAFGHVTNTFDGVRIDNPERLRSIVELKKTKSAP